MFQGFVAFSDKFLRYLGNADAVIVSDNLYFKLVFLHIITYNDLF